jgi:hypothetical protein
VLRSLHPETAFRVIDRHTHRVASRHNASERLLWERARLADLTFAIQQKVLASDDPAAKETDIRQLLPSSLIDGYLSDGQHQSGHQPLPSDRSLVDPEAPESSLLVPEIIIELYEELLMQYPDGFYAGFSRNRVRNLENQSRQYLTPREL